MKLPNSHLAVVEERKVCDYLLNAAHPDNGGKAAYFLALGFSADSWKVLADGLRRVAVENQMSAKMETVHGSKYIIDGNINGPKGKAGKVRTVWIVDRGVEIARLVTAYPTTT